ncbi:MAG: alpha/beta hydrolase [Acidimicrobiia bacterium]
MLAWFRFLTIAVLSVTFATGAAAGARTVGPSSTKPAPSTTTWPPLPRFATAVSWSDCGDGFQCGTLAVPVSWLAPAGETLPLALIRRPAASPSDRIGALVMNYGGPGESGVAYLRNTWQRLPGVVRDRFDLVSFDPRGTGASRPIDCVDDSFIDLSGFLPDVPTTDAALDAVHRYNQTFADGCRQRMGAYAGQVGTRNTARDLEAIRIALGEPKLTYLGYSYGTVLGAAYAQMFPTTIRAMVLDGPPDYALSARDYSYAQAQGFMRALDAFLTWCSDTSCAFAGGGAPRDVLYQLIDRVRQQPLPASYSLAGVTRNGALTPGLLETAVISLLYDESRGWPALASDLHDAVQNGWGGSLLAADDQFLRRGLDGKWSPLVEANVVIDCVDRPATAKVSLEQERADVGTFQAQLPPWGGSWATATCVGMPKPARGDKLGKIDVAGAPPILVVGTTGDPATPYAGAQTLVSHIHGAGLLTFESTEHTAFGSGRSGCIDDAVDSYLVGGTMPAPGTRCAAG